MSHIALAQIARQFNGALYSKLTSRERAIADYLLGFDALELNGNKLTTRN